jgi:hypothetical protein
MWVLICCNKKLWQDPTIVNTAHQICLNGPNFSNRGVFFFGSCLSMTYGSGSKSVSICKETRSVFASCNPPVLLLPKNSILGIFLYVVTKSLRSMFVSMKFARSYDLICCIPLLIGICWIQTWIQYGFLG